MNVNNLRYHESICRDQTEEEETHIFTLYNFLEESLGQEVPRSLKSPQSSISPKRLCLENCPTVAVLLW